MKLFEKWPHQRLGDISRKIGSGSTPRGGDSVYQSDGPAIIRSQNVYNGVFNYEGLAHLSEQHSDELAGVAVEVGDVLLNITGDSVARCCQAPEAVIPARVNQHVAIIRPDRKKLNPRFLCYYLISPPMQTYLLSIAGSGGTRKALTKAMVEDIQVPCPSAREQDRIADVLSAYDDLIENNRRRMALLEESARLLYQEWFVRLRFPGHERVRIVKGLPNGWRIAPFSEFVDYLEGPGLLNRQYRDEGVPFLNIRTIKDDEIDFAKVQFLDEAEVQAKYKHFLLAEDDHVISSSGTLGRVVTIRACHLPVMLNTSLIRMRARSYLSQWFIRAYLKHGDYVDQVTSMATGAAQLNYGPSHLAKLQFKVPTPQLASLYDDFAAPCYRQLKTLLDINLKLRAARDLLLPRLMSGEVLL